MTDRRRPREDMRYAARLGWHPAGTTGSGHYQYKHPGTRMRLIFSKTSSDERRAIKNSIAFIRKNTPAKGTSS